MNKIAWTERKSETMMVKLCRNCMLKLRWTIIRGKENSQAENCLQD